MGLNFLSINFIQGPTLALAKSENSLFTAELPAIAISTWCGVIPFYDLLHPKMPKVNLLSVHFFLEKHINCMTSKNYRYVPVFFQGFSLNLMKSEKSLSFGASHIIFFLSSF